MKLAQKLDQPYLNSSTVDDQESSREKASNEQRRRNGHDDDGGRRKVVEGRRPKNATGRKAVAVDQRLTSDLGEAESGPEVGDVISGLARAGCVTGVGFEDAAVIGRPDVVRPGDAIMSDARLRHKRDVESDFA